MTTTFDDFPLPDASRVLTGRTPSGPALTARRRWAATAGWRHAYLGMPVDPGDVIAPLCDQQAVVTVVVPTAGQPAPECPDCDQAWRLAEHIPLRTNHVPTVVPDRCATASSTREGVRP
jgi:hypothetical protein